jgi:hypothetical protein
VNPTYTKQTISDGDEKKQTQALCGLIFFWLLPLMPLEHAQW